MKHDRIDSRLDAVVNKGLAAALLIDVSTGLKLMREAGVPREVITRMLLEPERRRATDWKR